MRLDQNGGEGWDKQSRDSYFGVENKFIYHSRYRYSLSVPDYKYNRTVLNIITIVPWYNAWYFPYPDNARTLSKAPQQPRPFGGRAEELRETMTGCIPRQREAVLAMLAVAQYSAAGFANRVVDMAPVKVALVVPVVALVD